MGRHSQGKRGGYRRAGAGGTWCLRCRTLGLHASERPRRAVESRRRSDRRECRSGWPSWKCATTASSRSRCSGRWKYLPRWFHYYGGLADKIEGEVTPTDKAGMLHYIAYEPLGVVGAHHAVEFAAAADGLEARAGACGRQHGRDQAVGVRVGLPAGIRETVRGGRLPEAWSTS